MQFLLLGPLVVLLSTLMLTLGYLSWDFYERHAEVNNRSHRNSAINQNILEVTRVRGRIQELLLLYRLKPTRAVLHELKEMTALRATFLEKIQDYAKQDPTWKLMSASIVGGIQESAFLQEAMVTAVSAGQLTRADSAFRELSTIFEINSSRLKDFSARLQSELNQGEIEMRSLMQQTFWLLVLSFGASALLILMIVFFYRKDVLYPLEVLHRGLKILAKGDLQVRIPPGHAPREIYEMTLDFNSMAHSLATAQVELTTAREEAVKNARIKSDFLANMSHEIRTPMNTIIGMSEILSENETAPEKQKQLKVLKNSGQMLLNIVDDILDYSRLETGRIALERRPFDLRDLAIRMTEIIGVVAERKGLELRLHFEPDAPCWLLGDLKRVEQVMLNLLGNAVKFTEKGLVELFISVSSGEADKNIQMIFKDAGIGIAESDLRKLFTRFSQSDSSITKRFGGTGLGLAIVKQLLDLMGGKVAVHSELGRGSEFHVEFSLPEASPRLDYKAENTVAVKPEPLPTHPQKILLVDDSSDNRFLIKTYFKGTGYEIVEADNGANAVSMYAKDNFDVVLMDMQMPVLDGYAATAQIRAIENMRGTKRTPIIALTAYALADEVDRSHQVGCDAHLTKPIRKQSLFETINNFT